MLSGQESRRVAPTLYNLQLDTRCQLLSYSGEQRDAPSKQEGWSVLISWTECDGLQTLTLLCQLKQVSIPDVTLQQAQALEDEASLSKVA